MKIRKLDIGAFGKFKNEKFELSDGLNIVYGANGSGKSTLMRFIKAAFYGFDRKERSAALPWDGSQSFGGITYEKDGREFLCSVKFGKTARGDKCSVIENISGDTVLEGFPGEKLFGIGAVTFGKTAFVSSGAEIESRGDDEIAERLSNLKTSGDDAVSYSAAVADVEGAMAKLVAKRGRGGRVTVLEDAVEEIKCELARAYERSGSAEKIKNDLAVAYGKKAAVEGEISALKNAIEAEKFQRIRQLKNTIDEIGEVRDLSGAERMAEKISEAAAEVQRLKAEISRLEGEKREVVEIPEADFNAAAEIYYAKQSKNPLFFLLLALAVGFAVLGFVKVYFLIGTLLTAIAAFAFRPKKVNKNELIEKIVAPYGYSDFESFKEGYGKNKSDKAEADLRLEKISETERKLNEASEKLSELEAEAQSGFGEKTPSALNALSKSAAVAKAEAAAYKKSFEALLEGRDYAELEKMYGEAECVAGAAVRLEKAEGELRAVNNDISILERKNGSVDESTLPCELERQRDELSEKLEKARSDYRVLQTVSSVFSEAYEIMEGEFGGKLNDTAGGILYKITGDSASVRMNKSYGVKLSGGAEVHEAAELSCGHFQQIYLSFRLAMVSLMGCTCPIFLDDSLMTYDDRRAKNALEYLSSCERQIILFTCRKRDAELAAAVGANVVEI